VLIILKKFIKNFLNNTRMKNLILCLLLLYGCATPGLVGDRKVNIGMTKEQVLWAVGSPLNWTRQTIDGKVYETWSFWNDGYTYDFVDNILVGYSVRGRYYSKDKTIDVRDWSRQ
jgi:hypothetical protein